MMGVLSDKEIIEKMNEFLIDPSHKVDNKMKSKCYFKLGQWMKEKIEELSEKNIDEIQTLFDRSIQYNQNYYKAWHMYAAINFEAVESYFNRPGIKFLLDCSIFSKYSTLVLWFLVGWPHFFIFKSFLFK